MADAVNELATRTLAQSLLRLRASMHALEAREASTLARVPEASLPSARNLLHYIALRQHDIRELQEQLVTRGLSSLGRCEAYVMSNIDAVLALLQRSDGEEPQEWSNDANEIDFELGPRLLEQNTDRLFGTDDTSKSLIMVTMPSEAATDGEIVRSLLESGMGVMRINCAHDDQSAWLAMINHLRRAEQATGLKCCVAMDLAGPKIRTGAVVPGPRVVCWKPHRDAFGRVLRPAKIWFSETPGSAPPIDCDGAMQLPDNTWLALEEGNRLQFTDASGSDRHLDVAHMDVSGFVGEISKTSYVTESTVFTAWSTGHDHTPRPVALQLVNIPPLTNHILLLKGDRLLLTTPDIQGRSAERNEQGQVTSLATIGCTLPEIFEEVKVGDRVLLDDGKIAGVVVEQSARQLEIEITRTRPTGDRLRADKGINFPDTNLNLPALTAKDIEDLRFVAEHADIVNYSFVRRTADIVMLRQELSRLQRPDLAIVLKIENRQAFEDLPRLLLELMSCHAAVGVMIARGDLAVECGWERLVELQEEILCVCEAAHLPVIWATQVLDGLAKTGLPTRAEVTDAGMGARAECVMLNKGPNIIETVRTLRDILRRMQEHQVKKRSTFRRLQMAERFFIRPDATPSTVHPT